MKEARTRRRRSDRRKHTALVKANRRLDAPSMVSLPIRPSSFKEKRLKLKKVGGEKGY